MHMLIKTMRKMMSRGSTGVLWLASGLCKTRVWPSRTHTAQARDCLSMGQKCADQGCRLIERLGGLRGLSEVYLTLGNIGFPQKQTRLTLFTVCFSSCDLLRDSLTLSLQPTGVSSFLNIKQRVDRRYVSRAY